MSLKNLNNYFDVTMRRYNDRAGHGLFKYILNLNVFSRSWVGICAFIVIFMSNLIDNKYHLKNY